MKTYDRNRIIECADGIAVLNAVGIPTRHKIGRRLEILCPEHNDSHFGNCYFYTDQNRYYCYACHASGNIIDLVMHAHGWTSSQQAYDAMKEIADICGIESDVSMGASTISIPMLTKEEQELIGIYNSPVETDIETNDMNVRRFISSPLGSLRSEDPEEFCDLIIRKCNEMISTLDNNLKKQIMVNENLVSLQYYTRSLRNSIAKIRELREKYAKVKEKLKKPQHAKTKRP